MLAPLLLCNLPIQFAHFPLRRTPAMSVPSSNPSRIDEDINLRILTIDDNASIHEDYRKVLLQREANTQLNAAESILFDNTPEPNPNPLPEYQIDSAFQGEQGLSLIHI